jgi:large subunit ribosomal protein L25
MKHSKLIVEKRTIQGNQNRKLRKIGIIPAVIFSKTLDSVMIQIPIGEFTKVYKEAGKTHVIDVICDNESYSTIIHGIDIHPVKHLPRHVDFLAVDLKQKVEKQEVLKKMDLFYLNQLIQLKYRVCQIIFQTNSKLTSLTY